MSTHTCMCTDTQIKGLLRGENLLMANTGLSKAGTYGTMSPDSPPQSSQPLPSPRRRYNTPSSCTAL